MIPEYSTKLFQCGSRCLSHRAICGDLAAPRQGGRSGNRERSDLTLHCHRRADRAVLQRHDRCVRVLSQAKSTLWCCRGDSSQTLSPVSEIMPDRCTPEYERVVAKMGASLPYRRARTLLSEFLPLDDVPSVETAR